MWHRFERKTSSRVKRATEGRDGFSFSRNQHTHTGERMGPSRDRSFPVKFVVGSAYKVEGSGLLSRLDTGLCLAPQARQATLHRALHPLYRAIGMHSQ